MRYQFPSDSAGRSRHNRYDQNRRRNCFHLAHPRGSPNLFARGRPWWYVGGSGGPSVSSCAMPLLADRNMSVDSGQRPMKETGHRPVLPRPPCACTTPYRICRPRHPTSGPALIAGGWPPRALFTSSRSRPSVASGCPVREDASPPQFAQNGASPLNKQSNRPRSSNSRSRPHPQPAVVWRRPW